MILDFFTHINPLFNAVLSASFGYFGYILKEKLTQRSFFRTKSIEKRIAAIEELETALHPFLVDSKCFSENSQTREPRRLSELVYKGFDSGNDVLYFDQCIQNLKNIFGKNKYWITKRPTRKVDDFISLLDRIESEHKISEIQEIGLETSNLEKKAIELFDLIYPEVDYCFALLQIEYMEVEDIDTFLESKGFKRRFFSRTIKMIDPRGMPPSAVSLDN